MLDQGQEEACTRFGLAAVINFLNQKRNQGGFRASTRMLYEMAKKHDEWPGKDYAGSSCRGAIRRWKNMGVCPGSDPKNASKNPDEWAYKTGDTRGGYHATINETGAIYVSARVTDGWSTLGRKRHNKLPAIPFSQQRIGGNAFAVVGYN